MATKKKKSKLPSWVSSKVFILVVVMVISVAGVLGYRSFAATGAPTIPFSCLKTTIKLNSNNSCVLAAKKALNYVCQNKDLSTANSKFDKNMYYRVVGFQSSANIATQDGIIGKTSWSVLYIHNASPAGPGNLGCYNRAIDK